MCGLSVSRNYMRTVIHLIMQLCMPYFVAQELEKSKKNTQTRENPDDNTTGQTRQTEARTR